MLLPLSLTPTNMLLPISLTLAALGPAMAIVCHGDQVLDSGLGGTLTSANYPDNYEHNTDCSFTITPIPGNSVTIEFQDFHVDYSHGGGCMDFLTVERSCLGPLEID